MFRFLVVISKPSDTSNTCRHGENLWQGVQFEHRTFCHTGSYDFEARPIRIVHNAATDSMDIIEEAENEI
jgi:hypothetical protein